MGLLTSAKTWWDAQHAEGGPSGSDLAWESIAPADQAIIANAYNQRLSKAKQFDMFNPGAYQQFSGQSISDGGGAAQNNGELQWQMMLNPFYTEQQAVSDGGGEGAGYTHKTDDQMARTLRGIKPFESAHDLATIDNGRWNAATPYDMTQVDMLYHIDPSAAARYGITQASAAASTRKNMQMQQQREATHDAHFNAEAGLVQAMIGGMAGAGLNAAGGSGGLFGNGGIYGTGLSTGSQLGNTMVQGAIRGGLTSGLTGGNIGRGALTGGLSSGFGQFANGLTETPWMNRAISGVGSNLIGSAVNGRPVTGRGLLSSGLSGVAGGLTDNRIVNQAVGGLLNYGINQGSGSVAQRFVSGANNAAYAQNPAVMQRLAAAKQQYQQRG